MTKRALALMLLFTPALAACGLTPLYAGGQQGPVGQTLASVSVAPIEGEAGWLVRGALRDRLRAAGDNTSSRYQLVVRLDDRIEGFGVRTDDSVTRERRSLRARWQLVDSSNGETLIDDSAGSDSGIDVVGSEYATIAAERTALERLAVVVADQIVARIAVYASTQPAPGSSAAPGG